jgi:hypothetical protein
MGATREQIMTALVAQLEGITAQGKALVAIGRRLRDPENVPGNERPALFLVEYKDEWERPSPSVPPIRKMLVWAILYTDVGTDENLIPATQVNYFMEAIEAALAPDNPMVGRFTLGGLVYSCMLKAEGVRAAGDTTGKSLCAVPIEIILP